MRFTPFYTPTLEKRKRVYISGPMTGLPGLNADKFDNAATELRYLGYAVCNPIETSALLGEHLTHAQYLRFDFHRILEADFLVALPGWEKSKGARAEILMAIRMDVKVWDWATWGDYNLVTESDVVDAIAQARLDKYRAMNPIDPLVKSAVGFFGPWFGDPNVGVDPDFKIGGTD